MYSYYTSFCMPVIGMHIAQPSHLILHASVWHAYCTAITPHSACPRLTCPDCFSSTSHPLRSLFNPQARLTQGGRRLGSECQHRVCTLQQHMVCHNLISERGCTERQRLTCTIVCYYTSLCVPVLQIRHTRQGVSECKQRLQHVTASQRPLLPPRAPNLGGRAALEVDEDLQVYSSWPTPMLVPDTTCLTRHALSRLSSSACLKGHSNSPPQWIHVSLHADALISLSHCPNPFSQSRHKAISNGTRGLSACSIMLNPNSR